MVTDPLSDVLVVLDDMETTFRFELAILQEAQQRFQVAADAADQAARSAAVADLRRALRMLRKSNAEVKSFVNAALERADEDLHPET